MSYNLENLTTEQVREKLKNDPDFVYLRRFDFSLANVLERYPDGCPNKLIASALMLTELDVEKYYQEAISILRNFMGVTV